jgi:Asp-tRNA(Asn)/Glu-tRNA(Gln) amidotransferase A subunit family amidase
MSEGLGSGAGSVLSTFFRQSALANAIGLPALSVPCGFTDDRLPVGFQLIGAPFRESTLLEIAEAYQSATDWHEQHPDLDEMEHEPGALAR